MSSSFVSSDRQGFIEEKLFDSPINWGTTYKSISSMSVVDISKNQGQLIHNFPNNYVYSKRMAEHILVENNHKRIPLLILRPSIISASLEEPVPGWTDSIGIIGGIYMLLGLGILRELPCDENNIGDQVPVDIVVN